MSRPTPLHLARALGTLAVLWCIACTPVEQDGSTPPGSPAQKPTQPTGSTATTQASDTDPPPPLTGFFEPGNFATLTTPPSSDGGTPEVLSIASLDVSVVVEGRMARTEVKQVFRNHLDRQTEGTYQFTLPEGASISRLAMDVEGQMMEGELVERERARQIYEGIVRRRKDPALLEWQGGNRFQTQIFPIPARGTKTVILAYEQFLPTSGRTARVTYRLPKLDGEDARSPIERFSFTLTADKAAGRLTLEEANPYAELKIQGQQASLQADRFRPRGPLVLTLVTDAPTSRLSYGRWKQERFFLLDFVPELPQAAPSNPPALVLAVDTSAGIGMTELTRIRSTALALAQKQRAPFKVVLGDMTTQVCSDGAVLAADEAGWATARTCLEGRDAGGATNLGALMAEALKAAEGFGQPTAVVLFTDGSASLGELDADLLRTQVQRAAQNKPIALHTVAVGHSPDEDFLASVARVGGGHSARMSPATSPEAVVEILAHRVTEPLMTHVQVKSLSGRVEGLVPHTPFNIGRGQHQAIMGRLDEGRATLEITGTYRGQPVRQVVEVQAPAEQPRENMLVRFWARSVLEDMQRGEVNRPKVVQTSLYYGVMSRYTSFLVLENQEAYKRFEVERRKAAERLRQQQEAEQRQQQAQHAQNLTKSDRKLSDVLATNDVEKKEAPTAEEQGEEEEEAERDEMAADGDDDVEDAKVAAMDKTIRSAEPPPPPVAKNKPMPKKRSKNKHSKTKGGLDATGRGFGGGGKDFDGFNGRIAHLPQVIMGPIKADGALSQEAITPVVLRQVGDITACYQQELNRTSELRGRLAVQFTIDATGRVTSVFVPKNTLNEAVGDCIIGKVLRTWSFPSQTGPSTEVTVMFNLHRSGQDGTTMASLEALKDRTPYEEERLFQHYVAAKAKTKAARQLNAALDRMSKEEEREAKRLELLLHTQGAAQMFPAELDTALTKALTAQPSAALLRRLIVIRREQKRTEDLIRELIAAKPDPTVASSLIGALQDHEQGKTALAVVDGWVNAMAPEQALQLLNRLRWEGFRTAFSEPFFTHMMTVTAALLDKGNPTVDLLEARIDAAVHLKRPADVVPLVEKHCSPEGLIAMKACDRWVAALRAEPRIQALDAKLAGARLNEIRKIRARDIANPKLIEQHAELLGNMGQPQEADRVMSEMVEFRPHDYNLRTRYARRLDAKGQTEAACAQLGLAVQVNPAQRDTFRTMMGMRRKTEERAEAIKRCIVDGVSKLPVQRAVSLVLTWEDPRADIDLHIHEAGDGGEHVWYRDRESAIGGLLYYDITDGFGPEIYVLGSGPSGAYRLELVYYSGSAAEVRGTLTVLRNAGSPTETREERPFTLTKAKHGDKTPLTMGEFRL